VEWKQRQRQRPPEVMYLAERRREAEQKCVEMWARRVLRRSLCCLLRCW